MPAPKRKAEKLGRKQLVIIQRSAQAIREGTYRIRAILDMGMDSETVEAVVVERMEAAHLALAKVDPAIEECLHIVAMVPVAEDFGE